jgi:hypothetical protein
VQEKQRVRRNNSVQETFWEWGDFWFISSAKSPEEQKNHSFVREVKLGLKEGRAQLQFFCNHVLAEQNNFIPLRRRRRKQQQDDESVQ